MSQPEGHAALPGGLAAAASTKIARAYDRELAHRLVPWPVARRVVTAVAERAWDNDRLLREHALLHMRYLLEKSERAAEIEGLAREYAIQAYLRLARWFRPWLTSREAPENLELLEKLRGTGRGVILNFAHHGDHAGYLASVARFGYPIDIAVDPFFFSESAGPRELQMIATCTRYGGRVFPARGNSELMRQMLRQEHIVALASDVFGGTAVRMLGREVKVASGAARIAKDTGAWVVPFIARRNGREGQAVLQEPLDPTDFDSPESLLYEMMARQEIAMLEWPTAVIAPLRRWAPVGRDVDLFGWAPQMPLRT